MAINRDHSIDVLRGLAILLVILGHSTRVGWLHSYIWSFHMPLFFFISGILFNTEKYPEFLPFLKTRLKNIMLPYAFFYLVCFGYWVVVERHMRGGDASVFNQFLGLFYGTHDSKYNMFNGPLWFLPALFSMEIIYWLVAKLKKWWMILSIMAVIHIIGMVFCDQLGWLPWGLCHAMVGGLFLCLGNLLNQYLPLIGKTKKITLLASIVLLTGLTFMLLPYTKANLSDLLFTNYYLYAPVAMIGTFAYFNLSKVIEENRPLEWLGKNTMVLFTLHGQLLRIIYFVLEKVTHTSVDIMRHNIMYCLVATIMVIAILMPVCYTYNKWINPLLKLSFKKNNS